MSEEATKQRQADDWVVITEETEIACADEPVATSLLEAIRAGGRYQITLDVTFGASAPSKVAAVTPSGE